MTMDDDTIHETITRLVAEEHTLRSGANHGDTQRERLRQLEESLDQCWDLPHQRRARRNAGLDPTEAEVRDPGTVEGYVN